MAKELGRFFGLTRETRVNKEGDYQNALRGFYKAVESRLEEGCRKIPPLDSPSRQAVEFHGHPFYYYKFDDVVPKGGGSYTARPEDLSSIRCTHIYHSDILPNAFAPENYHTDLFHIVVLASPRAAYPPPTIEIATLSKLKTPEIRYTQPTERYEGQFVLRYVHFQLNIRLWLLREDIEFKETSGGMSERDLIDPNTVRGVERMTKAVSSWRLVDSRNPDHPDYVPPPKPEETVWGG